MPIPQWKEHFRYERISVNKQTFAKLYFRQVTLHEPEFREAEQSIRSRIQGTLG